MIGGTHWSSTLLTRVRTKITTLTHTGFLNKISVKDTEITLTACWITDPLLQELIILIVQPWRTVPLAAFYFSPSHSIVRTVTVMNWTMLAKFCSQFCCPPLQLPPWFICERYVEPNEGIPNFLGKNRLQTFDSKFVGRPSKHAVTDKLNWAQWVV